MLPAAVKDPLAEHLELIKQQHERDLEHGLGRVVLPNALERKYPNAGKEWGFLQRAITQIGQREKNADITYTNLCCRRR